MLSIPAKHPAVGEPESLTSYWTFYWAVAAAQLSRWLPRRPSRVLDLSGPQARCATQAAAAGHTVVEVRDSARGTAPPRHEPDEGAEWPARDERSAQRAKKVSAAMNTHEPDEGAEWPARDERSAQRAKKVSAATNTRTRPVVADAASLEFLSSGSFDAVVAEGRMLSRHLVTENVVAGIARVLRPGGRVLLSVDSLVLGMAILAEQNYWAQLSDVPRSEVTLVPWPDGSITRCFGVEQLRELLTECGLEVEWVRPRTALSPSTVEHVLRTSPQALSRLVRAELTAPPGDEPVGIHLVASAIKRF